MSTTEQTYRGNGQHGWEPVIDARIGAGYSVDRLRVPGGWLYRDLKTATLAFVPMPEVVKEKYHAV